MHSVDVFDASLFGITTAEADLMDPQQRLLLEVSSEGLQMAPHALDPGSGVYVGIQQMEYGGLAAPHLHAIGPFSATGGSFSVAAGRLSFMFGLKGPAVSIDTACSSAMVAMSTASAHIRTEDSLSTTSLVGTVNLMLSEATTAAAHAAGMLTLTGRCKTLDAAADGYVRAESCLVAIMKIIESDNSLRSYHHHASLVHAVAVNQDGRSSSLTAPNGPAQQAVIRAALLESCVPPADMERLHLHGTGTALGDPIEIGAAISVLPSGVRMSAAKSRVGHAEPSSGLVGIFHAFHSLRHVRASPISHLRRLNPMVTAVVDGAPCTRKATAARQSGPDALTGNLTTGVSAFAFQGTNSHAVLGSVATTNADDQHQNLASSMMISHTWCAGQRHWFRPHSHIMLQRAICGSRTAEFMCDMTRPSLAYLMDHRVSGRALLPGAAMFEASHAAAVMLLGGMGHQHAVALLSGTISSPLVLLPPKPSIASLEVDLSLGTLAISSSRNTTSSKTHMTCRTVSGGILGVKGDAGSPRNAQGMNASYVLLSGAGWHVLPTAIASLESHSPRVSQPYAYALHPATLDCATHTGFAWQTPQSRSTTRVPVGMDAYLGPIDATQSLPTFSSAALDGNRGNDVACSYALLGKKTHTKVAALDKLMFRATGTPSVEGAQSRQTLPKKFMDTASQLYVIHWQVSDPVAAAQTGAAPNDQKIGPQLKWYIGMTSKLVIPTTSASSRDKLDSNCVNTSLQMLQSLGFAQRASPITLQTPLLEPGLPDMSPAIAAAAGLLKVAAQELPGRKYMHLIQDGYNARHSLSTGTDVFGTVVGEGVTVTPRMLPFNNDAASHKDLGLMDPTPGVWIVTGGLGDIGGLVGAWLAGCSGSTGGQLVLVGRSGRSPESRFGAYSVTNAQIVCFSCDIATKADVAGLSWCVATFQNRITATFHAGGILNDAMLLNQTSRGVRAVCAPKVSGAARLHELTAVHPLDQAVHFSSLSAQLGTPGQANYAAANAALDAAAQAARNSGTPTCSILWGPWASGMALKDPAVLRRFEQAGLGGMPAETGIRLLTAVMGMMKYPSAAWIAGSIAWERLLRGKREVPAMFDETRQLTTVSKETNKPDGPVIHLSVDARSPPPVNPISVILPAERHAAGDDAQAIVQEVVNGLLGRTVARDQPLMEAGLDSLGAVELRNQLQIKLGVDLPATVTFDHPSVASLGTFLAASAGQVIPPQSSSETHGIALPLEEVRRRVDQIVHEVLGATVLPDQPLMAAGLDSLGAVELRNRISMAFDGVELPATLTFDHPTIEQLTSYIQSLRGSTLVVAHAPALPLSQLAPPSVQYSWSGGSEVIALSCRYPVHETVPDTRVNGSQSPALWRTLYASADLQRVVPLSRWDMERHFSPASGDNMRFYARFAAFCDGVEFFDPNAFRLSVQEATALDPQIRLLLEEASVACGNATLMDFKNYGSDAAHGLPVGIYAGCMYHEHMTIVTAGKATLAPQAIVGNGAPYMVGRLSYTFGFSGKLGAGLFHSFFAAYLNL